MDLAACDQRKVVYSEGGRSLVASPCCVDKQGRSHAIAVKWSSKDPMSSKWACGLCGKPLETRVEEL